MQAQPSPNLLNRIHLRRIRRQGKNFYVVGNYEPYWFMPSRSVCYKQNIIHMDKRLIAPARKYSYKLCCNKAKREKMILLFVARPRHRYNDIHLCDGKARTGACLCCTNSIEAYWYGQTQLRLQTLPLSNRWFILTAIVQATVLCRVFPAEGGENTNNQCLLKRRGGIVDSWLNVFISSIRVLIFLRFR